MLPCHPADILVDSSVSEVVASSCVLPMASAATASDSGAVATAPMAPMVPTVVDSAAAEFSTDFLTGVLLKFAERAKLARVPIASAAAERPKVFVNLKYRSHGKQWISRCCKREHSLLEATYSELPDASVVFYWIQREYAFTDERIFAPHYTDCDPCIAFIPSQQLMCDKVFLARTLHEYYGDDAWRITALTLDVEFDSTTKKWDCEPIRHILEKEAEDKCWIIKTNTGSLGLQVHMFQGNSTDALSSLMTSKFDPLAWQDGGQGWALAPVTSTSIVQEYVDNPLLFEDKFKFDIRCYGIIASTKPCIAFWHRGKMRICSSEYSTDGDLMSDSARFAHLANCSIQRKHEDYDFETQLVTGKRMLGDWDDLIDMMHSVAAVQRRFGDEWLEQFKDQKVITREEIAELVSMKCRRVMGLMVDAIAAQCDADCVRTGRKCQFAFHGWDLLVDNRGHFWLIEVNRCAAIGLNGTAAINQMTKDMLQEMVDIEMEIRSLKREGLEVTSETPLKSVNQWRPVELTYAKRTPL